MKFLTSAAAKAFGPKDTLIGVLRKNLPRERPARSHKNVHASDLTKDFFCPREVALLDLTGKTRKPERNSVALQATFDVGNATGDLVRERWMGQTALGAWRCRACCMVTNPDHLLPKPVQVSAAPGHEHDWQYQEVCFRSPTLGFQGSLDVLTDLGAAKVFITELKIMATDEFDALKEPKPEHLERTSLYMRLVEESTHPERFRINTEWALVLYTTRGHGRKHPDHGEVLPWKEFWVPRDDALTTRAIDRAARVKLFREKAVLPKRDCANSYCSTAKGCAVVLACFSGQYPEGGLPEASTLLTSAGSP